MPGMRPALLFRNLFPLIMRHAHGGAGGGFVTGAIGGGIGDGVNAPCLVVSCSFGGQVKIPVIGTELGSLNVARCQRLTGGDGFQLDLRLGVVIVMHSNGRVDSHQFVVRRPEHAGAQRKRKRGRRHIDLGKRNYGISNDSAVRISGIVVEQGYLAEGGEVAGRLIADGNIYFSYAAARARSYVMCAGKHFGRRDHVVFYTSHADVRFGFWHVIELKHGYGTIHEVKRLAIRSIKWNRDIRISEIQRPRFAGQFLARRIEAKISLVNCTGRVILNLVAIYDLPPLMYTPGVNLDRYPCNCLRSRANSYKECITQKNLPQKLNCHDMSLSY